MLSPILAVRDIDASVDFYVAAFGFHHNWSLPDQAGRTDFASVQLGGAQVFFGLVDGLVEPEHTAQRGTGFLLFVDLDKAVGLDIDAIYVRAKAAGALITREIADQEYGERTFHCQDRDGYTLMFAQRVKVAAHAAAA
ncbi:MAG: VOC family protein [bacterium]|nr:VOC family protein [bacterium]